MENKDYTVEILEIIRSNTSPGIMRNRLEDYHANDLAEVFPQLKVSERRKICRILDLDMLSDIFEHIDEQEAAEYLDTQHQRHTRQRQNIWMRWISKKRQRSFRQWRRTQLWMFCR